MNTRQEFDYIIVGARSAGCVAVESVEGAARASGIRQGSRHRGVYRATNARELSSGVYMCDRAGSFDSDLRVLGAEGLRVADASVMPSIVRRNTNAAVIAIAEKAADILLGKLDLRIVARPK